MLKWAESTRIGYSAISAVLALVWLSFLVLGNAWSPRLIGRGAEEYRQLAGASVRLFGLVAIASLLLRLEVARGYLAIALPVGLLGLVVNRRLWRGYAVRQRRSGRYRTKVLVVGSRESARDVVKSFERDQESGYQVVGLCTPGRRQQIMRIDGHEVPVVGDEWTVIEAVQLTGADTVAVAAVERLGSRGIRDLIWELVPLGVDLVVTPGVVDVADQRLQIRPVSNLPLLHIEKPQYNRATAIGKMAFDLIFAAVALFVVSPVMVVAAIAIKTTSHGPVFYRAERIGRDGKPFHMIKFRSMVTDAEAQVVDLVARNDGAGLLFKMRDDPRVTRVGAFLRRYSLDELPQFINVLLGQMSVVGPRPPLRREVERYDGVVRRRLLVKPGVTGLWQVSGRSDLSWDESVRLDLYYVENWSTMQDLWIIARTVNAVLHSRGAY